MKAVMKKSEQNEVKNLWLSAECAHGSKSCGSCPEKRTGKETVLICKCRCHQGKAR